MHRVPSSDSLPNCPCWLGSGWSQSQKLVIPTRSLMWQELNSQNHHLLPPRACMNRKLVLGARAESQPRHSGMGNEHLNHQTKHLPCVVDFQHNKHNFCCQTVWTWVSTLPLESCVAAGKASLFHCSIPQFPLNQDEDNKACLLGLRGGLTVFMLVKLFRQFSAHSEGCTDIY